MCVPPTVEVSENLTISSYEMAHVSCKLPSIEYHLGRYPDASEPMKATQLITEGLHKKSCITLWLDFNSWRYILTFG